MIKCVTYMKIDALRKYPARVNNETSNDMDFQMI